MSIFVLSVYGRKLLYCVLSQRYWSFPCREHSVLKLLPLPPVSDPGAGQPAAAVGLLVCQASSLIKHSSDENIPKIVVPNATASLLFQEKHMYVSYKRLSPSSQQQGPAEQSSSPYFGLHQKLQNLSEWTESFQIEFTNYRAYNAWDSWVLWD